MLTREQQHEVLDFCRQLVRIPSVGPKEKEVVQCIASKMEELGYDEVVIDEVGNVIGKFTAKNRQGSILFDGHVDTVGVTEAARWSVDPFGGEVKDGKIYGRGVADMKASIAAAVCGAAFLVKEGLQPRKDIYICGSVSEELIEGVALDPVLERYQPDCVVIGEATDLKLNIGQRGRAEITVECKGTPAHSSQPSLGVNALKQMTKFLTRLEEIQLPADAELGLAIIEPTDIISRPYPGLSVIPDNCRVTFDRRLLVGESPEEVLEQVKYFVGCLQKENPGFEAEVYLSEAEFRTYTGYAIKAPKFAPAWKLEAGHPVVGRALHALKNAGLEPQPGYYAFCTNGSYAAGKRNIPTIGFGIGHENQAHQIDEWVYLEDLFQGTRGYMSLFSAFSF